LNGFYYSALFIVYDARKGKKIIAAYFPIDENQFFLTGKASELRSIADKYGSVKEVKITEKNLRVIAQVFLIILIKR
jgi:hypothetical protein